MAIETPIRVLVVDDSPVFRARLVRGLSAMRGIEVVGAAPDAFAARDMIEQSAPDALVLDIEMPRINGLAFLQKVMQYRPTPTIVVSSLTQRGCKLALACLHAGAIDVFGKPSVSYPMEQLVRDLTSILRGARDIRLVHDTRPLAASPDGHPRGPLPAGTPLARSQRVVAIGASTGGTQALRSILPALPVSIPPILIVQHMPKLFTKSLARSLDDISDISVKEAEDGDRLEDGWALVAPGDQHMRLSQDSNGMYVSVVRGPRVRRHRPSVEVLFQSVAKTAGRSAMAVILTGMGDDGADAMRELDEAGSLTVAEDESTCVVFGMPRTAIERGGVREVVPLHAISARILEFSTNGAGGRTTRRP